MYPPLQYHTEQFHFSKMCPVLHLFNHTSTPNSLKLLFFLLSLYYCLYQKVIELESYRLQCTVFRLTSFTYQQTSICVCVCVCGLITYVCVLSHSVLSKHTGVGCHALLQEIFLTQVLNWGLLHLLHYQAGSLPLAPPGLLAIHYMNILKLVRGM